MTKRNWVLFGVVFVLVTATLLVSIWRATAASPAHSSLPTSITQAQQVLGGLFAPGHVTAEQFAPKLESCSVREVGLQSPANKRCEYEIAPADWQFSVRELRLALADSFGHEVELELTQPAPNNSPSAVVDHVILLPGAEVTLTVFSSGAALTVYCPDIQDGCLLVIQ